MGASIYSDKTPERLEAVQQINNKLAEIMGLYGECEEIAIKHGIHFSYGGPAGYGDGGYFDPSDIGQKEYEWSDPSDGWLASSQSC